MQLNLTNIQKGKLFHYLQINKMLCLGAEMFSRYLPAIFIASMKYQERIRFPKEVLLV